MPDKSYIEETFPEVNDIENENLREKVINLWISAMTKGGWEKLDDIPFTLLIPDLKKNFIQHTRTVTKMAMNIALLRDDLRRDLVIAGALVHDIGKLLEYTAVEDNNGVTVKKSEFGELVRHPVSGAALAMENGLPQEIVHIIAAHSKEGEMVRRIPEAIVIFHCDFIDFEIEKYQHGMK
jgi:putative nucleotidyltransferase with HDIG domain